MAKEAKPKDRDLTQSDPDPTDSSLLERTNNKIKAKGEIELGILLPVFCVLAVAWVAHRYLGMGGESSLYGGFAIVIGVTCPKYAALMLKNMSKLTSKFKNR